MDFKFAGYSKKNWRKYNFQIQFYLYCLKKLCQPSPEKGYIFFLKNNHVIEVDADPGFELNLEEKIKDFNRKEKI
jgi:hypothetical protein